MGSSESKLAESSKPEPNQCIKNKRLNLLIDPRSPSIDIDRTPIQAGGPVLKASDNLKNDAVLLSGDPRSPTIGITRTPVRDAMRVTVGSFARRLGLLFHSDVACRAGVPPQRDSKLSSLNIEGEEAGELGSNEPLLALPTSQPICSLAEQENLLTTPVLPALVGSSSPSVLLGGAQVDVETEAELTLEMAEEATESPLHKRLSMSLITCHNGEAPSQVFTEVHHECLPVPSAAVEPVGDELDHSYALPSVTADPESPPTPVQVDQPAVEACPIVAASSEPTEEVVLMESSVQQLPVLQQSPVCHFTTLEVPAIPEPSREQPQPCTGIRCPKFDPKSPSQVVFKPQWLGKDFGATGLKTRGVQARGAKGSSSPLALRVAVKNTANENKGQSLKLKQKGTRLAEGRSPLQILKETNSPREQPAQMKLKVLTSGQRLGQMDRRVLNMALDKENR